MLRRLLFILTVLALAVLSDPATSALSGTGDHSARFSDDAVAVIRPLEVRTRKLHLIRPDLLRFPMQYDTYC